MLFVCEGSVLRIALEVEIGCSFVGVRVECRYVGKLECVRVCVFVVMSECSV